MEEKTIYIIGELNSIIEQLTECLLVNDYYNTREEAETVRKKVIENDKKYDPDFNENDLKYYEIIKITIVAKKD